MVLGGGIAGVTLLGFAGLTVTGRIIFVYLAIAIVVDAIVATLSRFGFEESLAYGLAFVTGDIDTINAWA